MAANGWCVGAEIAADASAVVLGSSSLALAYFSGIPAAAPTVFGAVLALIAAKLLNRCSQSGGSAPPIDISAPEIATVLEAAAGNPTHS